MMETECYGLLSMIKIMGLNETSLKRFVDEEGKMSENNIIP